MINGVECFSKVNKDNAIKKAIVNVYWPSICRLKQSHERTM